MTLDSLQAIARDLLSEDELRQLEAMRERLQRAPMPPRGACREIRFAIEDALNGVISIAHGSFGLAPSSLKDAASRTRKAVLAS
ncbi:hypothetical protein [Sphingosinicella sp. BN140058]|uniref:hypothetical protein n=1 Tax=Sphingosinicella sp. BN140058 TaxID=1892855 RepID=UPI001010AD29|nr:hypothetical protein [Sphingosinicella sp. BN140058]QAY80324.1 hypothetical protein ETR14_27155 [Sphingosinicella sp. BN140058]